MIQSFNWPEWSEKAKTYYNNPQLLATVDLPTIQKLFTAPLRADRFCEGLLKDMIDDKVFVKLLIRLKQLNKEMINRFRGSLIGLAIGDALGVPLEFQAPGTFEPVTDMIGGGSFNLNQENGLMTHPQHYV
jgi:hypothetical protein